MERNAKIMITPIQYFWFRYYDGILNIFFGDYSRHNFMVIRRIIGWNFVYALI